MAKTFDKLVAQGRRLMGAGDHPTADHRSFEAWDEDVAAYINAWRPESGDAAEWSALSTSSLVVGNQYDSGSHARLLFQNAVARRLQWLANFKRSLDAEDDRQREPEPSRPRKPPAGNSKKVFVVHGHNDGLKEAVARLVSQLGLEPIIMQEQPNEGRTLIEKFLDCAKDVAFTVVLLTNDDVGGSKNAPDQLQPRARQNVIFELGFFVGYLDRKFVCALYEENVELPSDFNAVAYVPFDNVGGWKYKVAEELQAAGLPVDMNRVRS